MRKGRRSETELLGLTGMILERAKEGGLPHRAGPLGDLARKEAGPCRAGALNFPSGSTIIRINEIITTGYGPL